jgi:hypothetical protein
MTKLKTSPFASKSEELLESIARFMSHGAFG